MTDTRKAAMVSLADGEDDPEEIPGSVLITDDGESGRVYIERGDITMGVNLGDLMDAIKKQLAGGDKE